MSDKTLPLRLLLINELLEEERPPEKKRFWCKEWYQNRSQFSHSNLMRELRVSAPDDLKNFLRMDASTYDDLLERVRPFIQKKDTVMRDAITANEGLSATLRFLASGQSYEDLKFLTSISPQSLGEIVIESCVSINKVLKDYIKIPKTEEEWKSVAEEFGSRWHFPNCIGAMDGKHVEIKQPAKSGSYYFNYKKKFSIVLFALVNANYEFLMVEAGANGRISDGGVLSNSKFFEKFKENSFKIPEPSELPKFNEKMPYVVVGDDAFPLLLNLIKPYSGDNLTDEQKIFNYRLSRARRIVENAFGILASRFRVLVNIINLSPEKAAIITLTACYLHNFLRKTNPSIYLRSSVDVENINTGEIESGSWRSETQQLTGLEATPSRNSSVLAKDVRDKFRQYFNGVGAVSWQSKCLK